MPKFVFPKATNIVFWRLPQLQSFYPGMHASEWPLLEQVEVKECGKLDILATEISSFQRHEFCGLYTRIKHSLFLIDKDVSFPNLEDMTFKNLTTLEVVGCRSLKYLATYTIAKTLKRLRKLTVGSCERMTEIGATTSDGDDAGNDGEISFCQLQSLKLYSLPSLQYFFSGNCIVKFPSLKTAHIYNCPELKINCFEWKSSPELKGKQITEEVVRDHWYLKDDDDDDNDDC